MMLECIISPATAEKTPWKMFFIGFLYSSLALFVSLWIFRQYASLVMVFLTVLACGYLVHATLKYEEKKDMQIGDERSLLKEHGKALLFLIFLFFGFIVAFSLWYVVLPGGIVQDTFSSQMNAINSINGMSGSFTGPSIADQLTSQATSSHTFLKIFFNNMRVLFFCILFALFYGAGAIFILAWNASVIGAAIGNFVRSKIAAIAYQLGNAGIAHYFSAFSLGLIRYMTHGVFEILAYFMAALGAGIISIAVINHDYNSKKFMRVMLDSVDLIVLSIAILFVAALVEVYITPVFA